MEVTPRLPHLPSFLLILLLTTYLLPFSSSSATTTTTTTISATAGLVIELLHVDAHMNLTYQQHIHAAIRRTHHRALHHMQNRKKVPLRQQATTLDTPLHGLNGEYLMSLALGTPPTSFSAAMDTGSTLIWAKCFHPTDAQDLPIFDPESSSSYSTVPCNNSLCNINSVFTGCNGTDCAYMAQYADSSASMGTLSFETLTFGSLTVNNIGFGCSFRADGFDSYGAAVVGFNRGPLSLVSQLGSLIDHQFSYCLGGYNASNQSKLKLGPSSHSITSDASTSTQLLVNPASPEHYYVALHGISVGGKRLPIPESVFQFSSDGSGGVVVDSGSTFTGLAEEAYSLLKAAFIQEIGKPSVNTTSLDMETCFQGLPDSISIPTLTFHFEGGDLQVPAENYIAVDSVKQLSCLAILPTPANVNLIGATTMQNFLVSFDLGRNMITFTPTQCSTL
ncbi:aspartic proteinase nepenthesin-1-like [Nymphaea colorata]|nr:aspartic proteinase nepenthesin-1-like [Nymphaea colorata]